MGSLEAPQMAEVFGVPTFYVTDVIREDAGHGNIRIWNCNLRNGILVPVCEVIVPSYRLVRIAREASEFAFTIHQQEIAATMAEGFGPRH